MQLCLLHRRITNNVSLRFLLPASGIPEDMLKVHLKLVPIFNFVVVDLVRIESRASQVEDVVL